MDVATAIKLLFDSRHFQFLASSLGCCPVVVAFSRKFKCHYVNLIWAWMECGGGEFATKQHPSVYQRSVTVDSFDWLDTVLLLLVLFYFVQKSSSSTKGLIDRHWYIDSSSRNGVINLHCRWFAS